MPVSGLVVTLTPSPGTVPGSVPGSVPGTSPGRSPAPAPGNDLGSDALTSPAANPGDSSTPVDASDAAFTAVIAEIQQHPNFQVGERQNQRLPVVLDTPDKETDKACWNWINELAGVHHVDVAFIHFEDEDAFEASSCSAQADELIAAPTIGET